VPAISVGSGTAVALAKVVAKPEPKTVAMESGAIAVRRKLAPGTVLNTGPTARHAPLVSIKIEEFTVMENSADTFAGDVGLSYAIGESHAL
jgi:hypothetical protein